MFTGGFIRTMEVTSGQSSPVRGLGAAIPGPWPSITVVQPEAIENELIRRHQLERLLPADAVNAVLQHGALPTTGARRILTILFVDIRGSSRIEETLTSERTIEFLNAYLGMAAEAILANNGSVNKFIGDGVLAVFGLLDEPDHGAANALAAAEAIHRAFASSTANTSSSEPITAVVAIHTGPAIIGVVGLAERSDYAVLGAAVNVASRLEGEAKELNLQTVLSGSTVAALEQPPPSLRLVTRKMLRGLSESVEIWSIDPFPQPDLPNSNAREFTGLESVGSVNWSIPVPPRWMAFVTAAALACIFVTILAAVGGLRLGVDQSRITLGDIAAVVAAVMAAALCAGKASRLEGRHRLGWALIAASATSWAVGQATLGVNEVFQGLEPVSPSLADIGFLAALPLGILGVLAFWKSRLEATERWRAWLDGLIVMGSLTFAAWTLGLREAIVAPATSIGEQALRLAYPLGELLIATVLILVINRGARYLKGSLLLLLGGIGAATIASIVFDVSGVDSVGFAQGFANAGWVVSFLLIALASLWPAPSADRAAKNMGVDLWQFALPWLVVMLAALSAFALVIQGAGLDRFLTLLTAILGALLGISQLLAHHDSLVLLFRTRLSEKTLADVIAHAPIGIARANTDFTVIAANPSLGALLREPPEVVTGSAITKYLPTDSQLQMRQRLGELASGATDVVDSEVPMIRADGKRAWVHLTSTAVKNSSGQVDYLLTMLQDNTARHEAEEAAKASLAMLLNLNRLKTEFLQSVGHEFRTALIGIKGFSELMRDGQDLNPKEMKDFAGEIHDDAERIERMVTEFLDLDRIETGPASTNFESVNMNAIIRSEVENVKSGTDGLTFNVALDSALPALTGDKNKLSQVVNTLLQNAARHSPDGGQIVIAGRVHVDQVEVSVRDQGQGAAVDFDNPLFSHDDLYANNPIRKVVGTSLGMGIARQIVGLHGGRIWVDRMEGIGSEVHFTIPIEVLANRAIRSLASPNTIDHVTFSE